MPLPLEAPNGTRPLHAPAKWDAAAVQNVLDKCNGAVPQAVNAYGATSVIASAIFAAASDPDIAKALRPNTLSAVHEHLLRAPKFYEDGFYTVLMRRAERAMLHRHPNM